MTSAFDPIKVAFLYIDGAHQVLHSAPAAAELSRDERFSVVCLVLDDGERAMVERVAHAWSEARLQIEALSLPRWLRRTAGFVRSLRQRKRLYLQFNCRRLAGFDAIVMVERAFTLLRRFGFGPRMIYFPHGAGDRAQGFSRRTRYFDYVIVSGRKHAERMIAEKLVEPEKCAVSGSIKLGAIERLGRNLPRLFDNGRPVVLYNPHHVPELSSWRRWGREMIAAFAAQDEYNLIVAPHVHMFETAGAAERAPVEAWSVPGRILVDLGSLRCLDTSYTSAADIYMGDVSSQVYEFLSRPRPCVFLNAHGVSWQNDPNYAFWKLGEVVNDPAEVLPAVRRAKARHQEFLPMQQQASVRTLGEDWAHAPERAAELIRDFLLRETGRNQAAAAGKRP